MPLFFFFPFFFFNPAKHAFYFTFYIYIHFFFLTKITGIVAATKNAPGGVLVFFPSYTNMELCIEKWGGGEIFTAEKQGKQGSFFRTGTEKRQE